VNETPAIAQAPVQVAPDLASALAQMGQVLLAVQTGDTAVNLVAALAVETLPGTIGAGVTLVDESGKHTRAASNPLVEAADQLQYKYDSGPCLTAWRDQVPVYIADIAAESRWPEWRDAVIRLGVRSMLCVPMLSSGRSMGAIKVYSDQLGAYDAASVHVLELFAQQAAVLLANTKAVSDAHQLSAHLSAALEDRDVISQAAGILLAQGATDLPAALETLRSAARRAGKPIFEVAHGIVDAVVIRHGNRIAT
jgi:GAF domain-containing protein